MKLNKNNLRKKRLQFTSLATALTSSISLPIMVAASCGEEQEIIQIEKKITLVNEFKNTNFSDEDWEDPFKAFYQKGYTRENIVLVGDESFWGSVITKLELPNATYVSVGAFGNSLQLTEINLPKARYVGIGAFSDSPLKKIYMPKAKEIRGGAFASAINKYTTKITIPKTSNNPKTLSDIFSKSSFDETTVNNYNQISFTWTDENGNELPNEKTDLTPYYPPTNGA